MIERTTVDGREATVAYLHSDWSMADGPHDADLVKVIFDGGGVLFLKPRVTPPVADFNPNHESSGPRGGQFTSGSGGGGGSTKESGSTGFVSPNIHDLKIEQAAKNLNSSVRQSLLSDAVKEIHTKLGLTANSAPVIGAWSDGAENSVMVSFDGKNPELEKVALAMEGYIADQKAVLYFHPDPNATEFMARFTAQGDVVDVHKDLLERGLAFHTLRPTSNGTVVYVYGQDNDTLKTFAEAANAYKAKGSVSRGKGEFIGTQLHTGSDREQRDDARRVYEATIGAASGVRVGPVWAELRDRWTTRLKQQQDRQRVARQRWWSLDFNPNHDPDTGEFTTGGEGGTHSQARPPLSGLGAHRHPATISPRKPLAARRTENPETHYLGVDAAALAREPKYDQNINLLRNTDFYPLLKSGETKGKSSDAVAELFITKAAANYRFLLDHATPAQRAAGSWYRNSKAAIVANSHGFDVASATGLVSRMSPGVAWDLNLHIAQRIMETASGGRGSQWTQAMAERGAQHYPPEMVKTLAAAGSFDKLTSYDDKAAWMRLAMEADPQPYHKMNRDGTVGPIALNPEGKPFAAPVSVPDDNMARGIEMLESGGDREVISRLLGEGHKIRSFYNDLLDPEDGSEVVSDVHNAGGAVLMPVVPSHPVVAQMQGNSPGLKEQRPGWTGSSSKSATTGVEGLYGLYVDAVRRVAKDTGMRPADIQAITWWTKKEMFGQSSAKKQREAEAIWARYQSGELDYAQTQQAIWDHFTTRPKAGQRKSKAA